MGEPTASTSSESEKWTNAASLFDESPVRGISAVRSCTSISRSRKSSTMTFLLEEWVVFNTNSVYKDRMQTLLGHETVIE